MVTDEGHFTEQFQVQDATVGSVNAHIVRRAFLSSKISESPNVFVAYYHEDRRHIAKNIQAWFVLRYGADHVVTSRQIPPFVGSVEYYIREKLRDSDLLVIIIGPNWERLMTDHATSGALDDVHLTIQIALETATPVILVYVDGMRNLREIDLPPTIRSMLRYPALTLSSAETLNAEVEHVLERFTFRKKKRDITPETFDSFDELYERFWNAFTAEDWHTALAFLERIRKLDVADYAFRLQIDQYVRQLHLNLRLDQARPKYAQIAQVAETDRARAWEQMILFRAEYPEFGDPDNLVAHLQPGDQEALQLLDMATDRNLAMPIRVEAGRAMAPLGDPRPGTGLRSDGVPEIEWVRIPEGTFTFHYNKRLTLPWFFIARYPVTHAQFQAFVDDGGYQTDRWWEGLAHRETHASPQVWDIANHPRERLSWYDAMAFSRWLSAQLGYEVRLPTEAEWEKAARGPSGRIYPWGDTYIAGYANINEVSSGVGQHNLRQPTPVGLYPWGASYYGILDMVGNMWEWCLNTESDPRRLDLDQNTRRVLRGGSYRSEWMFAHTVRRRVQRSNARFPDFGFRLACDYLSSNAD